MATYCWFLLACTHVADTHALSGVAPCKMNSTCEESVNSEYNLSTSNVESM